MSKPVVHIVTGPTASGKTARAIELAQQLGCEIVNADSRQIYRGIEICTAAPTQEERALVPHHLVLTKELDEYYSAAEFADEATDILKKLVEKDGTAVVCGGSMMYLHALVNGLDELPTISDQIRKDVMDLYQNGGIEAIRERLAELDPEYIKQVDLNNYRRIIHAIEICLQAGQPYSTLRTGQKRELFFEPRFEVIEMPREQLFDRINRRVELMVEQGLVEEARKVYPLRHLNSLNTVGMKELFAYFDGVWDLDTAIARIQKNTRVYAKKQMNYLSRVIPESN